MNKKLVCAVPVAATAAFGLYACSGSDINRHDLNDVKNVVVIYAENRSFDNLYGSFPGANDLQNVTAASARQLDRDGSVLATLPKIWGGLTATGVTPQIGEAMTADLPNTPFAIDDPKGFNTALNVTTRDLYHRFYENQMQIDGGKNDKFAAWANSGSLVMGHYGTTPDKLPLYKIAQQYTLADNFFMGAFGGSFLNHQWLVCACTPIYPNADTSVVKGSISVVDADGVTLTRTSASPASVLTGAPKYTNSGNLTPGPVYYAVNTMQPPYQPSGNAPASGQDSTLADTSSATTLPPQTQQHISDMLNNAGVSWAWYGGSWGAALASRSVIGGSTNSGPNFQTHHQPFNYFADLAPGTANRAQHLLDDGTNGTGDRCRQPACRVVLQAAGQPERTRGLRRVTSTSRT